MKRLSLIFLLTVSGASAIAAKIIGNGGDVLVCENRLPRVQLLDFAETRILRPNAIQLTEPEGATYTDKLKVTGKRISSLFPILGRALSKEADYFERTNVKLNDLELEDVQDSFHKFHLTDCEVHQIANQSIPLVDDDPSFIIDNRLWVQLSEFDKAGLVLHEVIYRMGLRYGLEHSAGVRYLVSLFFDDDLASITDKQWIQAFMLSRIKMYEKGGVRIPLFVGLEENCEIMPGASDCHPPSEVRPATVEYSREREMSAISYGDVAETLEFNIGTGFLGQMTAKEFRFFYGAEGFRIQVDGRLTLNSGFDRTGLSRTEAEIAGVYNVNTEVFCGQVIFLRDDQSMIRHEKFCGNLIKLVDIAMDLKHRSFQTGATGDPQ